MKVKTLLTMIQRLITLVSVRPTISMTLLVKRDLKRRVHRSAGSKKVRGIFDTFKPPVVTLIRWSDGRIRFLVQKNLQDVDEDIAQCGNGTVILCTDQYTIYDGINNYDKIDRHLAIKYDDH